ncbi:hypothetical protein Tcan_16013 [Toxocara canis]|uniref:Uncharacterized protein n=1 Tax=Toxocara canis TaxID=6265 RepID=A0A0B2VYD2_TOXCA|nr:hypothetical protein Tcan_16013 [Toxocara canis]
MLKLLTASPFRESWHRPRTLRRHVAREHGGYVAQMVTLNRVAIKLANQLRHPTEESSSEGGDELVTAAAGRGGRTTTRSEKRDAQAGENGLSPAGQPLDENAGGAVGMA